MGLAFAGVKGIADVKEYYSVFTQYSPHFIHDFSYYSNVFIYRVLHSDLTVNAVIPKPEIGRGSHYTVYAFFRHL